MDMLIFTGGGICMGSIDLRMSAFPRSHDSNFSSCHRTTQISTSISSLSAILYSRKQGLKVALYKFSSFLLKSNKCQYSTCYIV